MTMTMTMTMKSPADGESVLGDLDEDKVSLLPFLPNCFPHRVQPAKRIYEVI